MKIAVFSESYRPYISGVSRSVELLKKGLEALGNEVYVLAPSYPGFKDAEKNVIRFPSLPSKYPGFRVAIPLPHLIPKIDFDVVHSNSPFLLGIMSLIYAKLKKVPYVYTFHTLFTEYLHYIPLPRSLSLQIIKSLIRSFCNRCDVIIVPSNATREYLLGFGVRSRIEVVPSGIDASLCERAASSGIRKNLGIPPDAKLMMYAGRLSKEKNVGFLLKVFSVVSKGVPGSRFLLVADGPVRKELEALAKNLGISDRTVFAGQVPYPDILNYYKASDLFVFSSKTETQGLVAAEARACGLPAVVLKAGGVAESVVDGEDGFLLDESIFAFAEKVILLLRDDAKRSSFSVKGMENSTRDFSSEIIAKKVEMIYNSLDRQTMERSSL